MSKSAPKINVFKPQNDRVKRIMCGFAMANGEYHIVEPRDMIPKSSLRRFLTTARAVAIASVDRSIPGSAIERVRYKRTFLFFVSYFESQRDAIFLVWNGVKGVRRIAVEAAQSLGVTVVFMELAPLPRRISIDFKGVNFGSSFPRSESFYRARANHLSEDCSARRISEEIVSRALRRPRNKRKDEISLEELPCKKFIFCPMQVPGDSQIKTYGSWIDTVEKFVDVISSASESLPDDWGIVLKQHPSSPVDLRHLNQFSNPRLLNGDAIETIELIKESSLVVTVNSSVGLEAALFEKPIVVLGQAMYDIPGFCENCSNLDELHSIFSSPETVSFDSGMRSAVIDFLINDFLFLEDDVASGKISLVDIFRTNGLEAPN